MNNINKSFERKVKRRATRIADLIQRLRAGEVKNLYIVVRYYREGGDFNVFLRNSKGKRQSRNKHFLRPMKIAFLEYPRMLLCYTS